MNRRDSLALLGTAALASGLAACGGAPKPWADSARLGSLPSRERTRARYFPDVVLTTHEGKPVRFYSDLVKDRIVVFHFTHTACTAGCPRITENVSELRRHLDGRVGRDIFLYSLTTDPQRDTPQRLGRYAERFGAEPGWLFLTGGTGDLDLLRRKLGFWDPDATDGTEHAGNLRYGNEAFQWWGLCPGLAHPRMIAKSILAGTEVPASARPPYLPADRLGVSVLKAPSSWTGRRG